MTTDTDKLVEMAASLDIFVSNDREQRVAMTPEKLAAFASAHIASLCGDVEPSFWVYELGDRGDVYLGVTGPKGESVAHQARSDAEGDGPVIGLYSASTVAALKATHSAEVEALKARIAELEKDAGRYRLLRTCRGQEHDAPFVVSNLLDGCLLWGNDSDAAITARGKT